MSRHIVVIDVGSKQSYIFGTNKQVLAVGASDLVARATIDWVDEAVRSLPSVASLSGADLEDAVTARTLLSFSGRAILHLDREEARQVIATVTRRALHDAPGMDVWGHIGVELDDAMTTLPDAVRDAFRGIDAERATRRSPAAAGQAPPFVMPCAFTGAPASVLPSRSADKAPRSRGIDTVWKAGSVGRKAFVDRICGGTNPDAGATSTEREAIDAAVVSACRLSRGDGVSNAGWVGVIHADGNGFGQIFVNLHRAYPDGADYLEAYRELSAASDWALFAAVRAATLEVHRVHAAGRPMRDWLLPILLGGDDAAMVVDGRYAWTFAKALVQKFTTAAAQKQIFADALGRVRSAVTDGTFVPGRLTMAAGLAYVKPHFPYSHANRLAEQLASSAKLLKTLDECSIDFHVHYESSLRDLGPIRDETIVDGTAHHAGPFILRDDGAHPAPDADLAAHAEVRAVEDLEEVVARLRSRHVSNTFAHALRAAALAGGTAQDAVFARAQSRPDLDDEARAAYRDLGARVQVRVRDAGAARTAPLPVELNQIVQAIDLSDVHDPRTTPGAAAPERGDQEADR